LLYLALVCSTTAPSAIYTLSLHDALPIWYKGAQLKKDAERRICAEIRRQLHGVHIRRPVMMRYLWVEPDRRRDRDNITAGRKFVQDALVRCKVLQNDGWKEIAGFSDDWAVDKARPRVEIEIIEMED